MIDMQLIKENDKPIAIVLDYNEYLKLMERAEDRDDYNSAIKVKRTNKVWIDHEELKKELKIR